MLDRSSSLIPILFLAVLVLTLGQGCAMVEQPASMFHSGLNLMQSQSARAANVLRSRESRMQASRELSRTATDLKRRNKNAEAMQAYAAAIELLPSDTENYLELARLYRAQEDWQAALKQLNNGLSYDPDNVTLRLETAEIHLLQGQPHLALSQTDRVMERQRDQPDSWRIRAEALMQLNKLEEAMAACYQALALRPGDEAVLERVCQIYLKQQRPMRSWSIVQKMSNQYTEENRPSKLRLLEAQTLVQMDRNTDAIQILKRWYQQGGCEDPTCCVMLAQCLDEEARQTPGQGLQYPGQPGGITRVDLIGEPIDPTGQRIGTYIEPNETFFPKGGTFENGTNSGNIRSPLLPDDLFEPQRPKFKPLQVVPNDWR